MKYISIPSPNNLSLAHLKSWQSVAVSVVLPHLKPSVLGLHVSGELQAGCVLFFTSCLVLKLMMNGSNAFVCLILLAVPDNMSSWTAGTAWSAGDEGESPTLTSAHKKRVKMFFKNSKKDICKNIKM